MLDVGGDKFVCPLDNLPALRQCSNMRSLLKDVFLFESLIAVSIFASAAVEHTMDSLIARRLSKHFVCLFVIPINRH